MTAAEVGSLADEHRDRARHHAEGEAMAEVQQYLAIVLEPERPLICTLDDDLPPARVHDPGTGDVLPGADDREHLGGVVLTANDADVQQAVVDDRVRDDLE